MGGVGGGPQLGVGCCIDDNMDRQVQRVGDGEVVGGAAASDEPAKVNHLRGRRAVHAVSQ